MNKYIILQSFSTLLLNTIRLLNVNLLLIVMLVVSTNFSYSQQVLNGSFENNNADTCIINLNSQEFHTLIEDITVIDTFGNFLDIIKGDCGWGNAKEGDYSLGIGTNLVDGDTVIEKIALKLSTDLVEGEEYNLSYYFKGWDFSSLDIGVSETSNDFGVLIQSSPPAYPDIGVWIKQDVNFIAPNNSSYLTLKMHDTNMILDWLLIDDFKFSDPLSINSGKEDDPICKVYPNPIGSIGELSIRMKGLIEIEVFDTFGKRILDKEMNHHNFLNKVNLIGLSDGVYILRMALSNGRIITKKIVKQ